MNWDEHRQACRMAYKKARSAGQGFGKTAYGGGTLKNKAIKAATSSQKDMAKDLKIELPEDCSMKEASTLISMALKRPREVKPKKQAYVKIPGNRPTPKQLLFAVNLGIKDPEIYSRKQLSDAIDFKIMERSSAKRTA